MDAVADGSDGPVPESGAGPDASLPDIDVSGLSEAERKLIWGVLKRDDDLRKRDEQRINRLKAELQWLRRRGAMKGGLDPSTSCARCRCPLGRIINRGAPCTVCHSRVCKSCRVHSSDGAEWICVVCHKQLELEAATGEWMNEFVRRASRRRDRKAFVPPSDLVKECIARAHHERNHQARLDREGVGHQQPRVGAALALSSGSAMSVSARRRAFLPADPPVERRSTIRHQQSAATDDQPPQAPKIVPAKPARRPSSSFADVALTVGNHFVREGERDPSPNRKTLPNLEEIVANRKSSSSNRKSLANRDLSPGRSSPPNRNSSSNLDDVSRERKLTSLSQRNPPQNRTSSSNANGTLNRKSRSHQDSDDPCNGNAGGATATPVPATRPRSTHPRTTPRVAPEPAERRSWVDEDGEVEEPVVLRVHPDRSPAVSGNTTPVPSARKRMLPTTPTVSSNDRRSDSGLGTESHSSPKTSYSGSGASRHSSTTSSSGGGGGRHEVVRNESRLVGGGSEPGTVTSSSAVPSSSPDNSASDLNDSEVEPSTGIVFRKVTLKRRKKREAPQPPGLNASQSTTGSTTTEAGTDDRDTDCDPERNRISYVPLPRWGLPGASFSLPRLTYGHSSCPRHHHSPRSITAGSTVTTCCSGSSTAIPHGSLTHTNSIDSLWWDAVPPTPKLGATTVIAVNGDGWPGGGNLHYGSGRSASPRAGDPIRFTGGLSRSLEDVNDGTDSGWGHRRHEDSYDDFRVSSPEYEEDYSLCGGATNANNNNSDSCSDILLHVSDRIVPEGEEYRIVFISSSSSKSSGLNSGSDDAAPTGGDSPDWYTGRRRSLSPPPPLPVVPPPPLTIHFLPAADLSVRCGTSPTYTFDEDELFGDHFGQEEVDWSDEQCVSALRRCVRDALQPELGSIDVCSALPPPAAHGERSVSELSFCNQVAFEVDSPTATSPLPPPGGFCGEAPDVLTSELLSPPAGFEDCLPGAPAADSPAWCSSSSTDAGEQAVVLLLTGGAMRQDPGAIEFSDETDLSDDEASSTASSNSTEPEVAMMGDGAGGYVDDSLDSSDDDCVAGSYDVSGHFIDADDVTEVDDPFFGLAAQDSSDSEIVVVQDADSDVVGDVVPVLIFSSLPDDLEDDFVENSDSPVTVQLNDRAALFQPAAAVNAMADVSTVGELEAVDTDDFNSDSQMNLDDSALTDIDVGSSNVELTSIKVILDAEEIPVAEEENSDVVLTSYQIDIDSVEAPLAEPETSEESVDLEKADELLISNVDNETSGKGLNFQSDVITEVPPTTEIVEQSSNAENEIAEVVVTSCASVSTSEQGGDCDRGISTPDGDKTESDTDSQDTVIEGEAYRRIRQVAIREKLMLANREWELLDGDDGLPFFSDDTQQALAEAETPPLPDANSEAESVPADAADSPTTASSRPGANLQALIAQSRALSAARQNRHVDGTTSDPAGPSAGPSVLEKYFVSTLEHVTPPGTRKHVQQRHDSRATPSPDPAQHRPAASDTDETDEFDDSCSDISDRYLHCNRHSETTTDEDSEATFDDDDSSSASSTSSDEGSMCLQQQQVAVRQCVPERLHRHQSLDMSLHTIMEESCEESEGERERYVEHKRRRLPSRVADPSDLERYFRFAFAGHASTSTDSTSALTIDEMFGQTVATTGPQQQQHQQQLSILSSELDSEFSGDDTVSETESSVFSESGEHRGRNDDVDDEELARLASSRLEKYFLTGFLGLEGAGAGYYGVEEEPVTPTGERPGGDDLFASASGGRTGRETSSEDEAPTPFEMNDGCDTIKRCKKVKDVGSGGGRQETVDSAVVSDRDTESTTPEADETMVFDAGIDTTICEVESEKCDSVESTPDLVENKINSPDVESVILSTNAEVQKVDPVVDNINSETDQANSEMNKINSEVDEEESEIEHSYLDIKSVGVNLKEEESGQPVGLPLTVLSDCPTITKLSSQTLLPWDATTTTTDTTCYEFTEPGNTQPLGGGILGMGGRGLTLDWKQQSRDSGFIGSSDDLLQQENSNVESLLSDKQKPETNLPDVVAAAVTISATKEATSIGVSSPPSMTPSSSFGLFRSSSTRSARSTCSDDEAHYIVHQLVTQIARSMTRSPQLARSTALAASAPVNGGAKPLEMEEFECQLTRLMRTVPGVDVTVKEIVEELSSTDYCSDSYEESSEDYDHEMAAPSVADNTKFPPRFVLGAARNSLRRNDSGRSWRSWSSAGSSGGGGRRGDVDDVDVALPEETMSIYNRFMESLSKMAGHEEMVDDHQGVAAAAAKGSPPITAKIVHHIRSRLTSLMREVHHEERSLLAECRPTDWMPQSTDNAAAPRRALLQWNKPNSATPSAAGDELSISSTTSSSVNFDSEEDSPTDKELSVDSDEDPVSALPVPSAGDSSRRPPLSGACGGSARALAEARAHVKAIAKSGGDLSASNDGSVDGLERWSSDVTIVGDADVRFTSVRKSEPALSAPSPGPAHSGKIPSSVSVTCVSSGSSRGGRVRAGSKNGSTGSLYYSVSGSQQGLNQQHHPRSKCRSEWEVWRGDCEEQSSPSSTATAVTTTMTPIKHKSCDPLLPDQTPPIKNEPRDVITAELQEPPPPPSPPPEPPREKRRLGLASFLLGSLSKSASSTSLRDNTSSASDYASAKQQVQFRSSLHLHTAGGKKSKDDRRHDGHHQGSPSSHPMQWFFGRRHRDQSGKKGGSAKGHASSRSSPSVLGRSSSPLDGVDVTTAAGVDLSDDDELSDERRPSRHSSLLHVAAHRPLLPADPYSTVPGHGFYRPSFVPSGATSSRDVSAGCDVAGGRASTLPRAFSSASTTHLHANVSFLHQSQRNLHPSPSAATAARSQRSKFPSSNTLPDNYSSSFSSSYFTLPAGMSAKSSGKMAGLFHHHGRGSQQVKPVATSPAPSPSVKKQISVVDVGQESPRFLREAHSWPDEISVSEKVPQSAPMPSSKSGTREKAANRSPLFQKSTKNNVPSISVVDCPERSATLSRLGTPSSLAGSHAGSSDPDSMTEEDIDRLVALHKNRSLSSLGVCSESMSSVYSAAGGGHYGNVTVRGEVQIGLSYNYVSGSLEVHVKQCRDLAPVDTKRNRSDPYVKVYLLPDKSKGGKRKTRVKKHTLNPLFNEVLKFQVTISELETRTLWLTVFHSDIFGRNEFLGEVTLPMGYEAWDDPSAKWYMLQERLGSPEEVYSYKGDLLLALRYVPPDVTMQKKGRRNRGQLHVLVKEARNLMALSVNGTSDPFCKCYLLPDKGKGNKQKTPVVRRSCNPKWNHTFVYEDVCVESLHDRCLELTVWDYDRLTSNDFLGGVRLSQGMGKCNGKKVDWMDSRGEEVSIWQAMLERPNVWVDGTVLLRPSMDHRQTTW